MWHKFEGETTDKMMMHDGDLGNVTISMMVHGAMSQFLIHPMIRYLLRFACDLIRKSETSMNCQCSVGTLLIKSIHLKKEAVRKFIRFRLAILIKTNNQ